MPANPSAHRRIADLEHQNDWLRRNITRISTQSATRTRESERAWVHALTILAGLAGYTDPNEARLAAEDLVTRHGAPRTQEDAARMVEEAFGRAAGSRSPQFDPVAVEGWLPEQYAPNL